MIKVEEPLRISQRIYLVATALVHGSATGHAHEPVHDYDQRGPLVGGRAIKTTPMRVAAAAAAAAVLVALQLPLTARAGAVRHSAAQTGEVSLDGCPEHVRWKDAAFPSALEPETPSYVYWLRSLFSAAEAASLVRTLTPTTFSTEADSIDHQPSYEVYLLGGGVPTAADASPRDAARLERARALVLPRFEQCVTPFLRRKFPGCEACVPCIALARRYKSSERTYVAAHRDSLSDVTVVVELKPANGSSPAAAAAAGGLFVQTSEESERNVVPMRAGEFSLQGSGRVVRLLAG